MDAFVNKLIKEVALRKEAELLELDAILTKKRSEALERVSSALPEELHKYLEDKGDAIILEIPKCAPINVVILSSGELRLVVHGASFYDDEPFYRDEWNENYTDIGEALYFARKEYLTMQGYLEQYEERKARQAETDYLSKAVKSGDPGTSISWALIGILDYLQKSGE